MGAGVSGTDFDIRVQFRTWSLSPTPRAGSCRAPQAVSPHIIGPQVWESSTSSRHIDRKCHVPKTGIIVAGRKFRQREPGGREKELRRELPLHHLKGSTGVAAVPGSNRIVNPVCTGTPFNISFGVTGTAG